MQKQLTAVSRFHTSFNIGISHKPIASLGHSKNMLRFNLMKEENEEYLSAAESDDIVKIADSLGDMLYVLCGTILEHGLQHKIEAIFDEIQRSNMSKLGANGQPVLRNDGKVIKGPDYSEPSLRSIICCDSESD